MCFDEPTGAHGAFGAGGPVEALVRITDEEGLKALLAWTDEHGVDYRVWGSGSTVLVRDAGLRGVVLQLGDAFATVAVEREEPEGVLVSVGAAMPAAVFVDWCAEQGLAGAERLADLAGSMGGRLIANAGTADAVLAEIVEEVTIVSREGKVLTVRDRGLRFEERGLKLPRTAVVVRLLLRLARDDAAAIAERTTAVREARPAARVANPQRFAPLFRDPGKVGAAVLIDEAGLAGVRVGGARIAPEWANAIVNENDARARDVVVLMGLIRERVRERTGITLENAIEIIGERNAG